MAEKNPTNQRLTIISTISAQIDGQETPSDESQEELVYQSLPQGTIFYTKKGEKFKETGIIMGSSGIPLGYLLEGYSPNKPIIPEDLCINVFVPLATDSKSILCVIENVILERSVALDAARRGFLNNDFMPKLTYELIEQFMDDLKNMWPEEK